MSDFDDWGSQSGFDAGSGDIDDSWGPAKAPTGPKPGSGGWHWPLSLVALVIVGLLSMGMAYLTRTVDERPVWMMGLIFMVPTAALMIAVMMVEGATSAMTPGTSRRPQMILAIIATVATFVVACICDLIYLQGFKKPLAPARSEVTAVEAADRLILVHDTTASMQANNAHEQEIDAVVALLQDLPDACEVGLVSGVDPFAVQSLTAQPQAAFLEEIRKTPDSGRLYYAEQLDIALRMVEQAGTDTITRIIFFTDGKHPWAVTERRDLLDRCLADQAVVYCILFGDQAEETLSGYAAATGGAVLSPDEGKRAADRMGYARYAERVAPAEVQEEKRLQQDLIRNRDLSANVITCIMLTLEGLSLGICLSLMMSVTGQFRIQYIISPLMGILAFFLLKMVWSQENMAATWWIKEGISFSLFGIVLMNRNNRPGTVRRGREKSSAAFESNESAFSSESF